MKQEVPALKSAVAFSISVSEGKLALMKKVIEGGIGASVGLDSNSVAVVNVNVTRLGTRQLIECAVSTVSFEVVSAGTLGADSPELAKLENDLKTACTDGSLGTYVKASAAEMGILTQCLKDQ